MGEIKAKLEADIALETAKAGIASSVEEDKVYSAQTASLTSSGPMKNGDNM